MPARGWTAVIINYNGADYLGSCLDALTRTSPSPVEIVVVDNASTDDSRAELVAYPRANLLAQPRNLGFSGGANVGLAAVETELAVLLNPDVEVASDFGRALLDAFDQEPRLGAAGALMHYPDGQTVQHAGGVLSWPKMWTCHRGQGDAAPIDATRPADVDYVAGGAMGLRIAAVRAIGGFDETFYPAFYEDVDLCLRLRRADWLVRYLPTLCALHHEGATLGASPLRYHFSQVNRVRFALKHLSPLEWRRDFVPGEIAALRHALAEARGEDWLETSGASGIEAVLRNPDDPAAGVPPLDIHAALLPGVREALNAARLVAEPAARPVPSKAGISGRVQAGLAGMQRLQALEEAQQRQAEFNRSVVAALEAQDKLNREQLALVLGLALDALQYVPLTPPPSSAPPAESADES